MVGYEEEENPRPQFQGPLQPNPINNKEEPYFPPKTRRFRMFISSVIIFFCALVVVFCIGDSFHFLPIQTLYFFYYYFGREETSHDFLVSMQ